MGAVAVMEAAAETEDYSAIILDSPFYSMARDGGASRMAFFADAPLSISSAFFVLVSALCRF